MNQPKRIAITVRAYGILRDRLKHAAGGRVVYQLEAPVTLADLLGHVELAPPFQVAVNGVLAHDRALTLAEGDTVEIFRSASGG